MTMAKESHNPFESLIIKRISDATDYLNRRDDSMTTNVAKATLELEAVPTSSKIFLYTGNRILADAATTVRKLLVLRTEEC